MKDEEALMFLGHSRAKAIEISINAKRGDKFSQEYLAWAKRRFALFKSKDLRR
jgi:hypothetical protein